MARVCCNLPPLQPANELDELADFNALISPLGLRLDMPRVIRDRVYARRCLDQARHVPFPLVRHCAEKVLSPLC